MSHAPVMLEEMLGALAPRAGGVYVDATFGGGGYSSAILEQAKCRVVGIDRDPEAVKRGLALAAERPQFDMLSGRFSELSALLAELSISTVDGIVADIGVSSYQLDDGARGFSFKADGPLDMRMSSSGESAAEIVNQWSQSELAQLFWRLGEEPEARKIAKAIDERRQDRLFATTLDLAQTVAQAKRRIKPGRDPATQVFQALRMQVNDELGELEALLEASASLLKPAGRLVVIAFHSLEDRLVKSYVNRVGGREIRPSRHQPEAAPAEAPLFQWQHRKPKLPAEAETRVNPRARSARLRVAIRQPVDHANDDLECDMPGRLSRFAA